MGPEQKQNMSFNEAEVQKPFCCKIHLGFSTFPLRLAAFYYWPCIRPNARGNHSPRYARMLPVNCFNQEPYYF